MCVFVRPAASECLCEVTVLGKEEWLERLREYLEKGWKDCKSQRRRRKAARSRLLDMTGMMHT